MVNDGITSMTGKAAEAIPIASSTMHLKSFLYLLSIFSLFDANLEPLFHISTVRSVFNISIRGKSLGGHNYSIVVLKHNIHLFLAHL